MKEKEIIKSQKDILLYVYSGIPTLLGIICTICVLCDGGIDAWFDYATQLGIETVLSWGGLILIIVGCTIYFSSKKCELVVTNKRITGVAIFGNRVDIPIDSVSAVGMIGVLKGISVSSSSGFIKFIYISNYNEIHKKISNMIMSRTSTPISNLSSADELKKYKELLDSGTISQEEFEAKKKQLLDL